MNLATTSFSFEDDPVTDNESDASDPATDVERLLTLCAL